MAWSVFSQPQGDLLAEQYAIEALQSIGAPTTPGNIQFMYQWQKSEGGGGKFNPLNFGPVPGVSELTSTGSQYGGGAADYVSWNASLAGFMAYMNMPNFQPIAQALRANNPNQAKMALWQSPWAASHYGYGSGWNNSGLPSLDPTATAAAGAAAGLAGDAWQAAQKITADLQGGVTGSGLTGLLGIAAGAPGAVANAAADAAKNGPSGILAGLGLGGLTTLIGDLTSGAFWQRLGIGVLGAALIVGGLVIFLESTDTGRKATEAAVLA